MSGIYIHVPYCKTKCHYCDFYSIEGKVGMDSFHHVILQELNHRKNYLPHEIVETIYFGGGTPSLIGSSQIEAIINGIAQHFTISPQAEVTLEANPDDLNKETLLHWKQAGINRLSIGVQSFQDSDLKALGRRHDSSKAIESINLAHTIGFENISIDLIYGLPYSNTKLWEENLMMAMKLPVKHLSSYHLIVEKGTPLFNQVEEGKVFPVEESISTEQYHLLREIALANGFIHYEISNFGKEGFFSRHNSSYWQQIAYLGLGPSAHSYNGVSRDWNPKSIALWTNAVEKGTDITEGEVLSPTDKLNDYLITSLRTIWGANLERIKAEHGETIGRTILQQSMRFIEQGIMEKDGDILRIIPEHFFISDGIISTLMVD